MEQLTRRPYYTKFIGFWVQLEANDVLEPFDDQSDPLLLDHQTIGLKRISYQGKITRECWGNGNSYYMSTPQNQ